MVVFGSMYAIKGINMCKCQSYHCPHYLPRIFLKISKNVLNFKIDCNGLESDVRVVIDVYITILTWTKIYKN